MNFGFTSPWQLLLWIVALEMITAPIVIFTVTSIYYGKAKYREQRGLKLFSAFAKAFEKFVDDKFSKINLGPKMKTENNKNEEKGE